MSITLLELKNQCRFRANMENSEFVTDAELITYINGSIAELHDILVQSYGNEYGVKKVTFNMVSGTESYSLDTLITAKDFYKLQGIDAKVNSQSWISLTPFNFNERNRTQNSGIWERVGLTNLRYRIVGSDIMITPTPSSTIACRLWYTPVATKLVQDTDSLDDVNQYSEYVIIDAAIKMLQKEESDVSTLMAQKVALKRRIEEAAQNRDAGKSESISDIYAEDCFWWS